MVSILVATLLNQGPAKSVAKAVEDDSTLWSTNTHMGDQMRLVDPGCDLIIEAIRGVNQWLQNLSLPLSLSLSLYPFFYFSSLSLPLCNGNFQINKPWKKEKAKNVLKSSCPPFSLCVLSHSQTCSTFCFNVTNYVRYEAIRGFKHTIEAWTWTPSL